jgi:HSP20 family protein
MSHSNNDEDDAESSDIGTGEVERVFPSSFGLLGESLFGSRSSFLRPLSRVEVTRDSVIVTFDIPGVSRDGISVTCTDEFVSIEAETRKEFKTSSRNMVSSGSEVSRYSERIQVPVPVDPDKGTAKFNNGMLVVKLPRVQRGTIVKITGDDDDS